MCSDQAYIREYVGPSLIATIRCKSRAQQQQRRDTAHSAPKQETRNRDYGSHNARDEAQKLRSIILQFLQKRRTLTVGDFAKWMAEEKGEAVSKQRVYAALRALVERKQIQRDEAGKYQLAGECVKELESSCLSPKMRIAPEEHLGSIR
jgi:hypothetical protein